MSTWFSAGAVLPQLEQLYQINSVEASVLTIAVNLGFLVFATFSAVVGLSDRVQTSTLIASGSVSAAVFNAMLLVPGCNFGVAVMLRVFTGASMAMVYPISCKHAAGWFIEGRGAAIGFVLGAVVLGAAAPHLLNGAMPSLDWKTTVGCCSGLSAAGG